MHSEETKILELNNQKLDKAQFSVYVDLECLIEKIDVCKNNAKKSSITRVGEHISAGFNVYNIVI